MVSRAFIFLILAISYAHAQLATTPGTDEELFCQGAFDLQLILDGSTTIGSENFLFILDFAESVVSGLDVSRDQTRVSLIRYTSWADSRFFFNTHNTKQAVLDAIADTPFYGRGTNTSHALRVAANHHLQPYSGWREGSVPTIAIVVTDRQEVDIEQLFDSGRLLRGKTTRVLAIGVGEEISAQLSAIATAPSDQNVFLLNDFSELQEPRIVDGVGDRICETVGDNNECLVDNGGCEVTCVNTVNNFYCECMPGFRLEGSTACVDIDECNDIPETPNGGCQQICTNLPGSFECSCNPGFLLTKKGGFCLEDLCFENNECQQICINNMEGFFTCDCFDGYTLNEDRRTCTDINECAVNNGGCEFRCNNTLGSFVCICPEGFALREDGRTCGRQCYACDRALTNEECNENIVVCPPNENACQTTTRRENGILFISKQCKQPEACSNNFIQNPRTAFTPTQCNDVGPSMSVCRCCCHSSLCNEPGECDLDFQPDIVCPDPFEIFDIMPPVNLSCSPEPYTIGDICDIVCPVGFETSNRVNQLVCTQEPRTTNGQWIGEIGTCVDIDECATNNGGCSHICMNTNGSFMCLCPQENPCNLQPVDLFFILDSSSSVGDANFRVMLEFVTSIGSDYDIGQGPRQTRVGLMTYNRDQRKRFNFDEIESNEEFENRTRSIIYEGRGTRTAAAIAFSVARCLTQAQGRRANADVVVIIITDGRSQDSAEIPAASELLHNVVNEVFVIGVTRAVNEMEIMTLAGGDPADYRIVDGFENLDDDLSNLVGDRICTQPEEAHTITSDGLNCDFDECTVNNGGCTGNCTNTVGSFFCSCAPGFTLVEDGVTCVEDRCIEDNGNCTNNCIQSTSGIRCFCPPGLVVVDGTDCVDENECLDEDGGCSDICVDMQPGYRCECNPNRVLRPDNFNCEDDSCAMQPAGFECAQICTNVFGGGYTCSCNVGYVLAEDGFNCTEINECLVQNGGCEHICVNTPGSFICECPDGQNLREDGRTCGIRCYECQNVLSLEECNTLRECAPSQDSCFTTERTRNNVTRITKGCQQRMACINNQLQNGRPSGEGPSQCNNQGFNSKCECCCFESECNTGECPHDFILPACPLVDRDFISYTGLRRNADGVMEVVAGGTAFVDCGEGYEFAVGGDTPFLINCVYDFENNSAAWDGDFDDLDTCVDIDECFNSTAGCVPPAFCVNLPGSFECECPNDPDDYVVVNDFFCERDECADPDQGGCSHNCTNTIGSYFCSCPPRFALVEDGLTCTLDDCQQEGLHCKQICVNTLEGFECRCNDGYFLFDDGFICRDINECETDNGNCSDICENRVPGFQCDCPEGFLLDNEGFNCRADPCFELNGGCEQICTPVEDMAVCSCREGYLLLDDGSCQDINECLDLSPPCQNNCTNFDGGFTCECPDGTALRVDGRTCGRACYFCNGAATNEICQEQGSIQVCPDDADACENEVRFHGGRRSIFKHCKQLHACQNNFIQNPRDAFDPVQCNSGTDNQVCRCCCTGHLCNFNERPCAAANPCNLDRADVVVVADSSSSVRFDNFQLMKSFIASLFASFNLGDDLVHAALIRYNRDVEEQFNLASINDGAEVSAAVEDMPYDGSGTRTGQALEYVLDNLLVEANGDRPDVTNIVITITDGRSQDDVSAPSEALRRAGAITFAVGVGSLDASELNDISGSEDRTFVVADFTDLSGVVLEEIQEAICVDENECENGNGGCSHECVNLQGSFFCRCPEGLNLDTDLRTCVMGGRPNADLCARENGGCSHICTNVPGGRECSCREGFALASDGQLCLDVDDCFNTSCSYKCVDRVGGFYCECLENQTLAEDGLTCVDRPGPADCPEGWLAIGFGCMRLNEEELEYGAAEAACTDLGSRLVKVNDEGTLRLISRFFPGDHWIGLSDQEREGFYINSDDTQFTFTEGWGPGEPGIGDCGYTSYTSLFISRCNRVRSSICEIPRGQSLIIFSRTWPNGALGKIYLQADTPTVRVRFPIPVQNFNVWFGSIVERVSRTEYIVGQSDIERASSAGEVGCTIDMTQRFPDREVMITPYQNE